MDGDKDADIYGLVDSVDGTTNPDDVVAINQTMTFTTTQVPPAGGRGDTVTTLRRGARAQFLVLNGQLTTEGPTQLIGTP
jgi:hypothetical protein